MLNVIYVLMVLHISLVVTAPSTGCARPSLPSVNYMGHETSFSNGQVIDVYCKEEYEVSQPQPTIQCDFGQWTSPNPECKLVECPFPAAHPPHGAFTAPCIRLQCTGTYTCNPGYWYTGQEMVCRRDKQWTDPNGQCQKVLCPELPDPANGQVLQVHRGYQAEVTIVCDEGYIYSLTSTTRRCQGDNTWSGYQGTCTAVLCPPLENPQHGQVSVTDSTYKSTATVTCDRGYVYTKHTTLLCQGNNTWTGANGTCERVRCPDLKEVENGILTARTGRFGDTVILQCPSGHILDGPSTVSCQPNGNWSAVMGLCRKPGYNKSDPLLPALLVPVLIVLIIACVLAGIWWYRKSESSDTPEEDVQLIPRKPHLHCSFVLSKSFEKEYSSVTSPEYKLFESNIKSGVIDAINAKLKMNVEVIILYLCKRKKKAFVDIKYGPGLVEKEVIDAMAETHIQSHQNDGTVNNIAPMSIVFREEALNCILADVHRQGHIADRTSDHPIDFDTQYVTLKLLKHDRLGVMQMGLHDRPDHYQHALEKFQGKNIEEEDLIEHDEYGKYVLIRGRAGIGKSTMAQQILWRWAIGEWMTKYKVMIMLNLRYLMTIDRPMSLPRMLCLYGVYGTGDADVTVDSDWLKENEDTVGFIFDGLDEIQNFKKHWRRGCQSPIDDLTAERSPLEWCFSLMARQCLSRSTLIANSRPFADLGHIVNHLHAEGHSQNLKLIELMGLTRDRVMKFVEKNTPENKIEFVKQTLNNNPVLMSVSAITFYCAALCKVLIDEDTVPDKLTTYTRITAYIMQLYMKRSMPGDMTMEAFYEELKPHMKWLSELAYKGLTSMDSKGLPRLVFDQGCFEDLNDETILKMLRSGLLVQTEIQDPEKEGSKRVLSQFIHLSIQEFLAMVGLLKLHPDKVQQVFSELCRADSFSMATVFIFGLAFNEDKTVSSIMNAVGGEFENQAEIQSFLEESVMNTCNSDDLHALQIAHESQSVNIVEKIGEKKFSEKVCLQGDKLTIVDTTALIFLLEHNKTASALQLDHADMDQYSVKELAKFLMQNQTLETVRLFDNNFDNDCAKVFFRALEENKKIQKLELTSDAVTDKGAEYIATGLEKNTSIKDLTVDGRGLKGKGVAIIIEGIAKNARITNIGLFCLNMTDEELKKIGLQLIPKQALELSLLSKDLTDQGVAYIAVALRVWPTCRLTSLSIDCQNITDKGVQEIADALMVNKSLKNLKLNSRRMTDSGVICITNMLRANSTLTQVSLLGFHMKESGLAAILQTLKANKTTHIQIWPPGFRSELTDEMEQEQRIKIV